MFGVVPNVDTYLKTITLKKFDEYSTDFNNAVDYSNNIDTSREVLREYQFGNYGLTNNFLYAEDNLTNPFFANGFFSISNELLSGTFDWISLNFAPTEMFNTINNEVSIALLPILNSNNELSSNLKPRIAYIKYYTGSPIPDIDFTDGTNTNTGVDFSTVNFANEDNQTLVYSSLRDNYHLSIINIAQSMEKLTLYLNLNAKEFNNIDFFKPVFLNFSYKGVQVAGMYLFNKIEDYRGGRTAKCEFTKLNPL